MDVYKVIKEYIVDQMTPTLTILTVVADGDNWKLTMCNTSWISPSDTVSIDGVNYNVESFVQDSYIIVSGDIEPPVTTFQLSAPHFDHGSHRKVDGERKASRVSMPSESILPMVYVAPVRNIGASDQFSLYDFEGNPRIFFLTAFDQMDELIETHQANVVNPMRAMADYFQYILESRNDVFEDEGVSKPQEFDHIDFGESTVWGNKENIFTERVSGVERVFNLKVFELGDCCSTSPATNLCQDVTTDFNGTPTEVDTASGQNISFNVVNELDAPIGTLVTNTANEKKVEVITASCDPVSTTMNGTALVNTPSGETKNFTLTYANGDPVVVTTVTNTANLFEGTLANVINNISYLRISQYPYLPTQFTYDVGWQLANNSYFDPMPVGLTPIVNKDNYKLLDTLNFFGNNNRTTNDKGNQNYTNVGGGLTSDGATANYMIDHLTGKGWYLAQFGNNISWDDSAVLLDTASIPSFDGGNYTGWKMPTGTDINLIRGGYGPFETLVDGIELWGQGIFWLMNATTATNASIWRQNQPFETFFDNFPRGANAAISIIGVRNHF